MGKDLREGVTTGSCAAAAALASILWQTEGHCPESVKIQTPSGKTLQLPIQPYAFGTCGVCKDAGDDPDVTDGCMVLAQVEILNSSSADQAKEQVLFRAGEGVGMVTAAGLKVPVGEPAINPVPRQMIRETILPYLHGQHAIVTISIPGGEELAKKTLNESVGVKGGLSILGTSGIVRPMSEDAMKESLSLSMRVRVLEGRKALVFIPGGEAKRAVEDTLGEGLCCITVSNYIGFMLDEAVRLEVETVLIAGFAGKLVKLAAGIMNTHSHVADGRRETLCTFAALEGADTELIRHLYACRTVGEAELLLSKSGYERIWGKIADAAASRCRERVRGEMEIGVLMFDQEKNILCRSTNLNDDFLGELKGGL